MTDRHSPANQQKLDAADRTRLHDSIGIRLHGAGQRYNASRRRLIDYLADAGRPLTVTEILDNAGDLPRSTAYRHLTALASCGVIHRLTGTDDAGYFELTDELSGHHHHHVLCERCGTVVDIASSPQLEKALATAAELAARETGFDLGGHRIDLVGTCRSCQGARL